VTKWIFERSAPTAPNASCPPPNRKRPREKTISANLAATPISSDLRGHQLDSQQPPTSDAKGVLTESSHPGPVDIVPAREHPQAPHMAGIDLPPTKRARLDADRRRGLSEERLGLTIEFLRWAVSVLKSSDTSHDLFSEALCLMDLVGTMFMEDDRSADDRVRLLIATLPLHSMIGAAVSDEWFAAHPMSRMPDHPLAHIFLILSHVAQSWVYTVDASTAITDEMMAYFRSHAIRCACHACILEGPLDSRPSPVTGGKKDRSVSLQMSGLRAHYALSSGQFPLSMVPAAYRGDVAAELFRALDILPRQWERSVYARRVLVRFSPHSISGDLSGTLLAGGHRVTVTLHRLGTPAPATPTKTIADEEDPDGTEDVIEVGDDEPQDDARDDAQPSSYEDDHVEQEADNDDTVKLTPYRHTERGIISHVLGKSGIGAAPARNAALGRVVARDERLANQARPRPLTTARAIRFPARSAPKKVLQMDEYELSIAIECPNSIGAPTLREWGANWFAGRAPSHLSDQLSRVCVTSPSAFMTEFFYRVEYDHLEEPWIASDTRANICPVNHATTLQLDVSHKSAQPLTVPISIFGSQIISRHTHVVELS